jgi:hypothetical protein
VRRTEGERLQVMECFVVDGGACAVAAKVNSGWSRHGACVGQSVILLLHGGGDGDGLEASRAMSKQWMLRGLLHCCLARS